MKDGQLNSHQHVSTIEQLNVILHIGLATDLVHEETVGKILMKTSTLKYHKIVKISFSYV